MVELSRDDSCACRGLHVLNAAQVLEEGEDAKLQVGYSTDRHLCSIWGFYDMSLGIWGLF